MERTLVMIGEISLILIFLSLYNIICKELQLASKCRLHQPDLCPRNAPTKAEWCESPRKGWDFKGRESTRSSKRINKICKKSDHPNIHFCKKKPDTQRARKTHKILKRLLKKIKKRYNRKTKQGKKGVKKRSRNKKKRKCKRRIGSRSTKRMFKRLVNCV